MVSVSVIEFICFISVSVILSWFSVEYFVLRLSSSSLAAVNIELGPVSTLTSSLSTHRKQDSELRP